jgi:hypothetical protein
MKIDLGGTVDLVPALSWIALADPRYKSVND